MAVAAARQREGAAERLVEVVVLGSLVVLALAAVAPLVLVAIPVYGALYALRTRRRAVRMGAVASALIPAPVAVLWASVARGADPRDAVLGYVEIQLAAAVAVAAAWHRGAPPDWLGYGQAVGPYAGAGGALLGAIAWLVLSSSGYGRSSRRDLHPVSADELGHAAGEPEPQPVSGFSALGRLTALTALPKQGKTFAWFGLLRARQTGGEWFGRKVRPGKTLVMTEEDRGTFGAKVRRFGIKGSALVSVHAPETADARFGQDAWAGLVGDAAALARKKGCDTLCVDTLTTWAPWAFRGPEAMSSALRTLKTACVRNRLAGVVILHNRKQQTDLGAIVDMLGTIAGSAAYDVIAGFKREKASGECTLAVDGRLGEWECTARLVDGRYVPVPGGAPRLPPEPRPEPPPTPAGSATVPAPVQVPSHLRGTLARVGEAGAIDTGALLAAEGGTRQALLNRLRQLEALKLVTKRGSGGPGDPYIWEATGVPTVPAEEPGAITDDPAYASYLKSPEWARWRLEALTRAKGHCERCGAAAAEVHHLSYERVGRELPEDVQAVCAPCHRRAHPAA